MFSHQPARMLTRKRIKTISMSIIGRLKSENEDFDIDFETFVKELLTDEVVWPHQFKSNLAAINSSI
jgi:hypothetical protein